jgi:hypothetical protein
MNGHSYPHLEPYFTHHLPSLGEAERENVTSKIRDIFSQQGRIFAYQDLPRIRDELRGLLHGKCNVENLSPVAAVYLSLDPDHTRDPRQITNDKIFEALDVLRHDIESARGYARSRPRDERTVARVTLLCELWSKLTGENPTHWNDEDRGPSSPCDQFVIAAFADFEEKPAWGAIRAALLENQLIDHQYGHSTDD